MKNPVNASAAAPTNARVQVPAEAPVRIRVNGERREVPSGTALDAVVASLTPASAGVAAALNETVVPRAGWASTVLCEGDRVEVLTAVQGG